MTTRDTEPIPPDPSQAATVRGERRRHQRQGLQGELRLTIPAGELIGRTENVSQSGVLFFTDEDLRVLVEYEEEGQAKSRRGRIVRMQAMRGRSTGWAVEFDE